MRLVRLLVLRRLRQAPLRAVATVLSIGAGVTLALGISVLLSSIDRSIDDYARGLAGPAALRISGATMRGGLPEQAVQRAAAVDGVAAVVPMVQVVGRTQPVPGGPLTTALVLGVDCRVETLVGPFGCDPDALRGNDGAIGVGPGVAAGPEALLRTDLGPVPIGSAPVLRPLRDLADGRAVVLPLPFAQQRFTRPVQFDVAYLVLDRGVDPEAVRPAIARAVGPHLPVRPADAAPAGTDAVLAGALPIYGLLGAFALGIGAVLVANTAAMALEARRRELAVVAALGAGPRLLTTATVAETALLGAAGGILGSLGGVLVAAPIVHSISSFSEEIAGVPLSVHAPLSAVVNGLLLGLLLGGGAAYLPARRASRLDVAAELGGREASDTARPPRLGRRAAAWSALAAIGLAGCWASGLGGGLEPWQAQIITPSFVLTILGTLFGMAALAPLTVGRLAPLAGRTASAPLRLAVAAARRDHRRTGLLIVTVGAAVVTAFVTEGTSASARASIEASVADDDYGVDVRTVPFDDAGPPDVDDDLIQDLAEVDGVAEVHVGRSVMTGMAGAPVLVTATTGHSLRTQLLDGRATAAGLAAGRVVIGPNLARSEGVRAGDTISLPTATGEVELEVEGVWENGSNVGRNVTMAPEALLELFGPQPAGFVALRPASGVSQVELAERVRAADLHPDLRARTSTALADAVADDVDEQFSSFRVMQQALLAVLFAAVLCSLLLAAVQRRRELGLLSAVGADPQGIARMLLVEAGVVGVVGVALAVVPGLVMMFAMNKVAPFVIGFRNPLAFEWSALLISGAIAVVVVLAGAGWPARRAARVDVLDALRYE